MGGATPFEVGERLDYEARIGRLPAGRAVTRVAGTGVERGAAVWRFEMEAQGGLAALGSAWSMASWTERERFVSRRFHRRSELAGRVTTERFEIVPDSLRYRKAGDDQAWVAPARPLDELALLYYLRTLPLAVGGSVTLDGYFRDGWNPIRVRVLGRERVTLGNRSAVTCLRLRLTAAGSTSEVWLTDDARRIPAKLSLPLPMGRAELVWTGDGQ